MGNKVNSNLFRLKSNLTGQNSYWSALKFSQYKNYIYQEHIIREFFSFILDFVLKIPTGIINVSRDLKNQTVIFIPVCITTVYCLKKKFSKTRLLTFNKRNRRSLNIWKNKTKERIVLKQRDTQVLLTFIEQKIAQFSNNEVRVVFKNYYNSISRQFFSMTWSPIRRIENRFKRNPFFNNMPIRIAFALKNQSADILLNLCIEKLKEVPNGRHHLVLNIFQSCLPLYLMESKEVIGVRIQVSGNLQGSERKKKRVVQVGTIPLQTISSNVKFVYKPAITKYGVFGVKVWMFCAAPELNSGNYFLLNNLQNKNRLQLSTIMKTFKNIT